MLKASNCVHSTPKAADELLNRDLIAGTTSCPTSLLF